MSIAVKKRLSPGESRAAALDAARQILIESGPQAVTLKAVAARVDRTHANLLHHFGSAAGLHQALIESMAEFVTTTIRETVFRQRANEQNPREVVDLAFDAFDTGGAGALASWMILSGNEDALTPILQAIHDLVEELREEHSEDEAPIEDETLRLVLMALGDALFGAPLARALGLPRNRAREIAYESMINSGIGKRG
ncbi:MULTISPECIES: TetR/AcrR family transcriptional regulator [unclassified Sphingopyxis]|uniref:TetR/AcrR family transcriptional regulator n=1 Tax=unclassified Sphingopyxis TaxID=2614943 RepID=UPI0024AE0E7F|nr:MULTISPECIES: TetR/AcrR family transcriptional regulator [unclassified Sphingopyxis]